MDRPAIRCSKRPLLVAGHGIRLAKAQKELSDVLNSGIPCVTTFNGFDLIPNDHPCFVGRIGAHGTYGGHYALSQCDTVIFVGTRNNMRQIAFDWNNVAPQAQKIAVDIDWDELTKPSVIYDLPLCMDAKEFLENFNEYVDIDIDDGWLKELKDYDINHPVELSMPYKFINDFTKMLPEGSVVVCGNATACLAMFQAGVVKCGQRIFWNSGTASMGYALPASIGAHFATGKEVYCITGDGSLQMNIQELQTIKHYNLPIKIIVINNMSYRSIEITQDRYFGDLIGCNEETGISFPCLEKVAKTYGFTYLDSKHGNSLDQFFLCWKRCIFDLWVYEQYEFKPKFTKPLEVVK